MYILSYALCSMLHAPTFFLLTWAYLSLLELTLASLALAHPAWRGRTPEPRNLGTCISGVWCVCIWRVIKGCGERAYVRSESNTQWDNNSIEVSIYPPLSGPERERIVNHISCVQHSPYLKTYSWISALAIATSSFFFEFRIFLRSTSIFVTIEPT